MERPKIPENTVSITLSLTENDEIHCGFGWNIPEPETENGGYLYATSLGLLWMLTKNMSGLTQLGITYDRSQENVSDDPSDEAEILDFPLNPTKH